MEDDKLVEVIEDGRIMRVPEIYALREGLPILRRVEKPKVEVAPEKPAFGTLKKKHHEIMKDEMIVDNFRKPSWKEKQVATELVENFNWIVRAARRRKGVTKTQLAKQIGEREEHIRMIENGVLPTQDFILINKLQQALGINLRKDKIDYTKSAHDIMRAGGESVSKKQEELNKRAKQQELKSIFGNEVEIVGDF